MKCGRAPAFHHLVTGAVSPFLEKCAFFVGTCFFFLLVDCLLCVRPPQSSRLVRVYDGNPRASVAAGRCKDGGSARVVLVANKIKKEKGRKEVIDATLPRFILYSKSFFFFALFLLSLLFSPLRFSSSVTHQLLSMCLPTPLLFLFYMVHSSSTTITYFHHISRALFFFSFF